MIQFLPELRDPVETEWRTHLADHLQTLFRIPSGFVAATCELFRSDPAKYDLAFLLRYAGGELTKDERETLWESFQRVKSKTIWYSPVSAWKPGLKYKIEQTESNEQRQALKELLNRVAQAETPKAAEIRNALKPLLKSEFESKLKSLGGGVWEAPLAVEATSYALVIDFGRFARGFAYGIRLPVNHSSSNPFVVSYEKALGFTSNDWDLLRTDFLDEQLGEWCRNVRKVLNWLTRINWSKRAEV